MASAEAVPKPARQASRAWPTLYCPLPLIEVDRALEAAGTNGVAIYAALHQLRFRTPQKERSRFYASEAMISRHCGLSPRRLRSPLRALEDGGVVKIDRPKGLARINHEACRYTLLPIFQDTNKNGGQDKPSAPRQDNSSDAERTQTGAKMSVKGEAPLTGGDSTPAALGALVRAPAGGGESRDEHQKPSLNPKPPARPRSYLGPKWAKWQADRLAEANRNAATAT